MQDETTTAMDADGLPEIVLREWYRVTSAEDCDGLNRLTVKTAEPPETTPTPAGDETTTQ